ncbi:MAG TPA: hypothetical protein VF824_06470, partial [Thermoanaerobaculia bacterium]
MGYRIRTLVAYLLVLCSCAPLFGATATDFYLNLLRRGMADVEAARYAPAVTSLRIAAFGVVDAAEYYQLAHVYLAVAHDKLGHEEQARDSALRVLAAERIEPHWGSLAVSAPVRAAFEALSKRLLSATETAVLAHSPTTGPRSGTLPAPRVTGPGTSPSTATAQPGTTTTQPSRTPAATTSTVTSTPQPPVIVDRVEVETQRATSTTTPGTATQPRTSTSPSGTTATTSTTTTTLPSSAATSPSSAATQPRTSTSPSGTTTTSTTTTTTSPNSAATSPSTTATQPRTSTSPSGTTATSTTTTTTSPSSAT